MFLLAVKYGTRNSFPPDSTELCCVNVPLQARLSTDERNEFCPKAIASKSFEKMPSCSLYLKGVSKVFRT